MFKKILVVSVFSGLIAGATNLNVNEKIWSQIDAVNALIKPKGVRYDAAIISKALEDAVKILKDRAFEDDYQSIRSHALTKDFKEADKMRTRAEPVFVIQFDGDHDVQQIDFKLISSLVAPASEAQSFVDSYPDYINAVAALQPEWDSLDCYLAPFNYELAPTDVKQARTNYPRIHKQWTEFAKVWKLPFFKKSAQMAVRCLEAADKRDKKAAAPSKPAKK